MLVFIDESGCPGFKLNSSSHLTIGMVMFKHYDDADETRETIRRLARAMGIKPEFKFSKSRPEVRTEFFAGINHCDYDVRAIVVPKSVIYNHYLRNNSKAFYRHILKHLISNNQLKGAKVRIDGNAPRDFQSAAKSYLKRETPPGTIDSFKFIDSKCDELVQLADMVTGAITRPYRHANKSDAKTWRNAIAVKIKDVWEFE